MLVIVDKNTCFNLNAMLYFIYGISSWMLPHLFINEGEVMRMNAKDTFILMQFCIIIYLLIIITLLLIIQ